MLDFIIEHWFIESVITIVGGFIIAYGICWLFDQCDRKD